MIVTTSHHDARASLQNNLSLNRNSVDLQVGDPLVDLCLGTSRKYVPRRKQVDEQSEVSLSVFDSLPERFQYSKPDYFGVTRPMSSLFVDGWNQFIYRPYIDLSQSNFMKWDVRPYLGWKIWVSDLVWNEDGTFMLYSDFDFYYVDLLDVLKQYIPLDFNDLPPVDWVWQPKRKGRYRFWMLNRDSGESIELERSECTPFLKLDMSSLRWIDFKKRAENLEDCSGHLEFMQIMNTTTRKKSYRLKSAEFCRQRLCPMCMWRRSMVWYSRFLERFEPIREHLKNHRLLHLVLTVPNVHISELRLTLKRMNEAWRKMTDVTKKGCIFPEFKIVHGFVRSIEVTREYEREYWEEPVFDKKTGEQIGTKKKKGKPTGLGREGYVHPHFHIMLAVPSTYMARGRITSDRWLEVWQKAMKMPEIKSIDIKLVQRGKKFVDMELGNIEDIRKDAMWMGDRTNLLSALPELIKYATKPAEFLEPYKLGWETATQRDDFYYFYEREVKFMRFISTGGVFKDILGEDKKLDDVTSDEMVAVDSHLHDDEIELKSFPFVWEKERGNFFLTFGENEEEE